MPKHSTHKAVSKLLLGQSYPSVDQTIDSAAKFLGSSHRSLLHTYPEGFVVGVLVSHSVRGGVAGCLHVLVDQVDSHSKGLVKRLIEGAR